jgi:hypothetical protein
MAQEKVLHEVVKDVRALSQALEHENTALAALREARRKL